MAITTITNNPKVKDYCDAVGQQVTFIKGHSKDVLFFSRDLLSEGSFKLAADPLGGYMSRPNPYHTVFLTSNEGCEVAGDDILRVEKSIIQWERYTNIIEVTGQLDTQYRELDLSLASNTLKSLLKNPI